jgi:ribosomal protein S26
MLRRSRNGRSKQDEPPAKPYRCPDCGLFHLGRDGAVRENLIKRCAYCMREAAAILLARGASPDDELIARHAGAMKVGMRAPLGSLKPAPKKAAAEVAE